MSDLQPSSERSRIPSATYRLQFNKDFTLPQALAQVDYLLALGVSDLYASPLFQACPESTHGYDICRFDRLNPVLGTAADFNGLSSALGQREMGLLLDMVPNHMGCDCSNSWWWDVLAKGRSSRHARFFDIDWSPPHTGLRDKIMLPVLEDHYHKVLEAGKLRLRFADGMFWLAYYDKTFPVSPESAQALGVEASRDGATLDGLLSAYNGVPGQADSFDKLHALLQAQHYRLSYWRVGLDEINYRRFFDITGLVSLRMELPEVFQASHELLCDWIASGQVTGVRIDHPDGLWDPRAYFHRLQEAAQRTTSKPALFILAEKILTDDEPLPEDWPIHGTTGYDFLNRLNGIFVAGENEGKLDAIYRQFTGRSENLQSVLYASKEQVLFMSFKSELAALTHRLRDLSAASRFGQDLTFEALRAAVTAAIVAFPVYRTYADENMESLPEQQRRYVEAALRQARKLKPNVDPAAFNFLEKLLLLRPPPDLKEEAKAEARRFVMRFQQVTGPLMAKGLEDTAFYRFHRLVSLNEVGGNPGQFGTTVADFHQFNRRRAERWPHSLLATATHDTKRGEDVRARINLLSELPDEWQSAVEQWRQVNRQSKTDVNGTMAPSASDEYLLYQTIIGAWPFDSKAATWAAFRGRVRDYMIKAAREGKLETSWLQPNAPYEKALALFVESVLGEKSPFRDSARALQERIAYFGRFNSLAQTVLKLTCPGVPDIYQGTELWDLSLVDPDNRRPVDYERRQTLLAQAKNLSREKLVLLLREDSEGLLKLFVLRALLHVRRENRRLFESDSYLPLEVEGPRREHICAFARTAAEQMVIILAPRLCWTLMAGKMAPPTDEVWEGTQIRLPTGAPRGFKNVLTEQALEDPGKTQRLPLNRALAELPVAVLLSGQAR